MSGFYESWLKRPVDFAASACAFVILIPVMVPCAFAVWAEDRGRVLFRQQRVGRGGRIFTICKFRSMQENVGDVPSHEAARLPITRVGRLLRRTNLDELPQLWNVICGDMSLVGPRPALPTQSELIALRLASRASELRPGLTGLAQVSSYDGMPIERKAAFDGEYAAHVSFAGDAVIIVRTIGYLFRRPPVY